MTEKFERHPFLRHGRADVLAHRGASHDRPPGNTIAAFERALELGVDHIETDVQATSDGVVVIFHDDRLDDITTGSGHIGETTWDALRDVRYVADGTQNDEGLLRFDDALERFPQAFFNIDVKTDQTVEPVVDLLREHSVRERTCIAAFGVRRLRRLRRTLGPGWCTAHARSEIAILRLLCWLRLPLPRLGDVVQAPRTHRRVSVIDERFIDACHRRGVDVHVWTVNDSSEMERLGRLGVDAVITDRPDLAR